jgi:hypothetical protein
MNRILIAGVASSLLVLGANAVLAAPATTTIIADEPGKPLTLTTAKSSVGTWLASVGRGNVLRAGKAEYDGAGNVKVEVDTIQGLPYTHVVVHATDGTITDSRTGALLGAKG